MKDEFLYGDAAMRRSLWRRFGGLVFSWRTVLGAVLGLVVLAGLYYPIGMMVVHRIDDDPAFAGADDGGSRAVATAAALIAREVSENRWTANDPFFLPGAALDNMPNYQTGMIYALSRFAVEMGDQVGRTRGSSQVDADLDNAAGMLKFPGDRWVFDPRVSWLPGVTSEKQYLAAREALLRYNRRLASGQAVFERRADNLQATLERFAADLGSASATIDAQLAEGGWFDTLADDVFYATKGRLYAYYLLLRDLGTDFDNVISERELGGAWAQMLDSLRQAATLDPWVVINGAADGAILPSHVAGLGFYLLRARTQVKEISNILLK